MCHQGSDGKVHEEIRDGRSENGASAVPWSLDLSQRTAPSGAPVPGPVCLKVNRE